MYKQALLIVFSALSILSAAAQESVEKLFQSMPDNLLWLDQSQRKDLLAYFTDKKVDSIGNNMETNVLRSFTTESSRTTFNSKKNWWRRVTSFFPKPIPRS